MPSVATASFDLDGYCSRDRDDVLEYIGVAYRYTCLRYQVLYGEYIFILVVLVDGPLQIILRFGFKALGSLLRSTE